MKALLVTACGCSRMIEMDHPPRGEIAIPLPAPGPVACDPIAFLELAAAFRASGKSRRVFEFYRMINVEGSPEGEMAIYRERTA